MRIIRFHPAPFQKSLRIMLHRTQRVRSLAALVAALILPAGVQAGLAPYAVDANTLHLWHLDEAAPPCADSVAGGTNLTVLAGGATLGNLSFTGFGNALSTVDGGQPGGNLAAAIDAALSPLPLVNGAGDNVPWSFANPGTGAFTFEALVWIGFDPAANLGTGGTGRNLPMQIITGEQDGTGGGVRSWQFRLDPVGFNPNADGFTVALVQPALEFINVNNGASPQNFVTRIPTNGVDAIASNQWYQVAVTYSGSANTAGNLLIYWTLMDSNRPAAAQLSSRQMTLGLNASGSVDLCLGNTGRTTPNNNFLGLIDEVRISSVARSPTNFFWLPPPTTDSDGDGLPDSWELAYFGNLSQGATNDPDGDGFNNLAEYNAGSNPTNILSTPLDTDADGLPDAWEQTYFGSLAQTASGDFDGDGFSNLAEYNAGTNPSAAASTPLDTDADGMPDAWEIANFGNLNQTALGDFDGDGFNNLSEYLAGSNPTNALSIPPGPAVNYIPIEDGNLNTSEFGYAGSSSINSVNFVHNALHTENGQQFIAYYYRHATDAGNTNNNRIVIARRSISTNLWQMFFTPFTANTITDGHDVAAFGIDGNGFMHLSWGMHGDAFHYAKTTTSVFGTNNITFGPDTTMTGNENTVTYPQWLRLPNGDLLYFFREGVSGSGDTYLNHYYLSSQTWSNVHVTASVQQPFLKGRGWTPDYNAYPNMPVLDTDGTFYLVWTWRYNGDSPAGEVGYQTNHDFDYARSTNGGLTWIRQNGVPYALPISQSGENGDTNTVAEKILSIPEGYSLINQAGMCLDMNKQPVIAAWWAPGTGTGNFRRQYMVAFRDASGVWQTRQVSNRTNDLTTTKFPEANVRDLGRPVVVCDSAGRLIVLYRDNFGSNGLTIVHSLPYAVDPQRTNWTTITLTTANLGNYEPVIDQARWTLDNHLQIVYQPSEGEGYTAPANTAAQIGVIDWNAAAYFAHRPPLQMNLTNRNRDAVFVWNSQLGWSYRLWASTNLSSSWSQVLTTNGTGGALQSIQTNATILPQRFWRLEIKEGGLGP